MKRTLALSLLAVAVPFVPGPRALAQASPVQVVACPSDTPIAPPVGDVDQFVAFDAQGCPVPSAPVPAVESSRGPAPAPGSAPVTLVQDAPPVLSETPVVIPVEDGLVATTGQAEAEAASRPKPDDYQQRLDAQYCAELPWKCSDAPFAELYG
jgi:hypothetical protein